MNIKLINHLGNVVLLLTLAIGIVREHWLFIFIGAFLLSIVRVMYIKAEEKLKQTSESTAETNTESQPTVPVNVPNTLPSVRLFATYMTALIMIAVIYGIGYGIGALLSVQVDIFPFI